MGGSTIRVRVEGRDGTVDCAPTHSLLLALRLVGIPMDTECGGLGRCGLCRVQVLDAAPAASHADRQCFSPAALATGWRLACTMYPMADCHVAIPEALAAAPLRILTEAAESAAQSGAPSSARAGYGLAIDIGTTTLACYLMRLTDGELVDVAAFTNPQRLYGQDVVSRIVHAHRSEDALRELRTSLIAAIEARCVDICQVQHIDPNDVHMLTLVGNSTMMHILCGVDPWPLGVAPYEPVFTTVPDAPAHTLGFDRFGHAHAAVLPGIGGQLGADTVAGLLALSPRLRDGVRLFVDLGTNGEIVLVMGDTALGCSCAAGPAFEGVHISAGSPAVSGAVDSVSVVDAALRVTTIDDAPPVGICGSGLVDAVAVLLEHRVLNASGRMCAPGDATSPAVPEMALRVRESEEGRAFVRCEPLHGAPIILTQQDIREVQLAKGAVRAGVDLLLEEAGIAAADVDGVYIAGGFGTALRPPSVAALGLFPGVLRDRIQPVGNAAGLGARLALAGDAALAEAHTLAQWVTHISLAKRPNFHQVFTESLRFPDPAGQD